MFTSAIKKQASVCCSISLNPYNSISNLEIWNHGKRKEKGKQFYCLLILLMSAASPIARFMCEHCL